MFNKTKLPILLIILTICFNAFSTQNFLENLTNDIARLANAQGTTVKFEAAKNDLRAAIVAYKNTAPAYRTFLTGLEGFLSNKDSDISLTFKDLADVLNAAKEMLKSERLPGMEDALPKALEELLTGVKKIHHILVVGRTRGGKSTCLATLLDPLNKDLHQTISRSSIFSHTVMPETLIGFFMSTNNGLYIARLIDTPGLSEVKSTNDEPARSDENIIDLIANEVASVKIDKVLQLFPIGSTGVNPADVKAFSLLQKVLLERNIFKGKIDLVFPRADTMLAENLECLINQFEKQYAGSMANEWGEHLTMGSAFNKYYENQEADFHTYAPYILFLRNLVLQHIFEVDFSEYFASYAVLHEHTDNILNELCPQDETMNQLGW